MKKNIFLVTWYNSINYGTCIQCYALAKYLRNNNYNVYIPNTNRYYYGLKHPFETINNIYHKICARLSSKNEKLNENTLEQFKIREKKNTDFAYKNTKISVINSKKDYQEMINKCDYFISGSDQIWNPNYVTPPMLLGMAKKNKIKIAYGSSIGVSEIPKNMINFYKKYLKKYDYIGLRENTAKEILKDLINKETQVVLDPSFLLNKKDWQELVIKPKKIKENENNFIFCYFIGNCKRNEDEINKFAHDSKLPIYYAMSESKIMYSFGRGIADMGVEEFIWCLLNAKYVITDSFHAVALSINFNKNFYVYKRFSDVDEKSQNSRIIDIVKTFDLTDFLESKENNLENIRNNVNFKKVNQRLNELREKSYNFLNKALNENNIK